MRQGRGQIAFTAAGRPRDENILVLRDPRRFLREPAHGGLIDAPLRSEIDVLDARVAAQPRPLQPLLKRQILPPRVLPVDDQRQLVFESEIARRFVPLDGFQSIDHALQSRCA